VERGAWSSLSNLDAKREKQRVVFAASIKRAARPQKEKSQNCKRIKRFLQRSVFRPASLDKQKQEFPASKS
jgi:hypothetical protein